jgi:hypothetical protein
MTSILFFCGVICVFNDDLMFLIQKNIKNVQMNVQKITLTLCIFFLVFFSGTNYAFAFKDEKTKKITGSYETSFDDWCIIKNKFGDVKIEQSTNSTLTFEVNIKVTAGSEKKAQAMIDGVNILHNKEGKYVNLITEIAQNVCNGNCSFEINYVVKLPAKIHLDVENKFGNVSIADASGKSTINVKHGHTHILNLSKTFENKITSEFGNLDGGQIGNASLIVRHGNAKIQNALKTDLVLAHSNFSAVSMTDLTFDSKHSNMAISSINSLTGEVTHGDFSLKSLTKFAKINAKHSAVEIARVEKGFEKIEIDADFSGTNLLFAEGTAFSYNIEAAFGSISVKTPNNTTNIRIIENNSSQYAGKVNGGGTANIRIDSKHGSVTLK